MSEPELQTIIANDVVIDAIENEDGSVTVRFWPLVAGQRIDFSDVVLDRFYGGLDEGVMPSLRALAR